MEVIDREHIEERHRSSGYFVGTVKSKPKDNAAVDSLLRQEELIGEFDGVRTFMDYLEEHCPTAERDRHSDQAKMGGFNEFDNYAEAMRIYKNEPRTVRKFEENDAALKGGESSGIDVVYDVTGDYLDISRYLEGEPESSGIMHNGNPRGRRVNLYINSDFNCYVAKDDIIYRGQRLQRLVDWLENQQVRVGVTALFSAGTAHVEIKVKDHDQVLDLNDVAIVSHSDFFRRLVFRFEEYSPTWEPGYGTASILGRYFEVQNSLIPDFANELILKINNVDGRDNIEREFDFVEEWLASQIMSDSVAGKHMTILGSKRHTKKGVELPQEDPYSRVVFR